MTHKLHLKYYLGVTTLDFILFLQAEKTQTQNFKLSFSSDLVPKENQKISQELMRFDLAFNQNDF